MAHSVLCHLTCTWKNQMPEQKKLRITNPRHDWVRDEFKKLLAEWEAWEKEVDQIEDHPIPEGLASDVFKDGKANIRKHQILQEKTRTFLDNNVEGHNFILGFDGNHIDRTDLRLKLRVEHRLDELCVLDAALTYAILPEGYWTTKAKEVMDQLADKAPEQALNILGSYLENPMKKLPPPT